MAKKGIQQSTHTTDLTNLNLVRFAHSYLMDVKGGNYALDDLNHMNGYLNYITSLERHTAKKYKVGLVFVCINQPYWQYAEPVIQGVRQFFLPGHDTEILMWSDVQNFPESKNTTFGADKVIQTESVGWPYPTLMRYHMFLEEEEYLQKFDYLFYLDLDMRVVNIVGDEILGKGLMMAQHPMYALSQNLWYPYEPNPSSTAHINLPGRIMQKDGNAMFQPLYAAGGFQGGETKDFIEAMKAMKAGIDTDLENNYIARWNDESHWNKYLYEHPPSVVLDPSYVYPDSMIDGYYKKIWGRDYTPRIVTLTKPFSTSADGGAAAAQLMNNM